jgi:hypothetical protein
MAQRRSFKMKIKEKVFEVTIKPLFNIFGWTLALVKAKRIDEDSNGKGTS